MSKLIQCYDLPGRLIKVLCEHGFTLSGDLFRMSPEQLQKVTNLSLEECSIILNEINSTVQLRGTNALQLLKQEVQNDGSIFTLCPPLNDLLHDGFPVGKLIEVAGESGTGKTQLCLQLCINAQISQKFGGLGGDAVFIDTENSFRPNRLVEIAQNIESRLSRDDEFTSEDLNVDKVLDDTIVEYCFDWTYFRAVILGKLDKIIEKRPKVRLIIVDSIAYLLRYDYSGAAKARDEIVWEICNKLKVLAIKHRICVVVTNHVSYDPKVDKTQSSYYDRWGHFFAIRLFLERVQDYDKRKATLVKSLLKEGNESVFYKLGSCGIETTDDDIRAHSTLSIPNEAIEQPEECENGNSSQS